MAALETAVKNGTDIAQVFVDNVSKNNQNKTGLEAWFSL